MQAKNTAVIWTVVVATIVMLLAGYLAIGSVKDNTPTAEEVAALVVIPTPDAPVVDVPTAAEIAALINIPDNDNDDILEGVYPNKVRRLERQCIEDLENEFDRDDVLDDLEDLIEDMEGEEIVDLEVTDWNFKGDYDFDVINLGLDDEDDKAGRLSTTLRVQYELEDGNGDKIRDKAYLTASCDDFDEDDDEFDDLEYKVTL